VSLAQPGTLASASNNSQPLNTQPLVINGAIVAGQGHAVLSGSNGTKNIDCVDLVGTALNYDATYLKAINPYGPWQQLYMQRLP
jgi:hypothetical protein